MADDADRPSVEQYVLRLLDECREEIRMCDSKTSILFAGVSFAAALLAQPLLDDSSSLRESGTAVVVLSIVALAVLVGSIGLLGLAVLPRVAHPAAGRARYFEEQAMFADAESLLAVLGTTPSGRSSVMPSSCWCWPRSHIASTASSGAPCTPSASPSG